MSLSFDFKDKVVVVTGGSRGIGRGIAQEFAKAGAKVAITYHSNEDAAKQTLSLLGPQHRAYKFNAADPIEAEQGFAKIQSELGGLHVLINNAGITKDQLLLRMKPEEWDGVMTSNLKSVFACTKAALKSMLRAREGSVVNITSVIGQTGQAGQSNYAASKAGIIGFTKSIAQEVASRQIRVNCIAPGFIKTDMTDSLTEDQKKNMIALIPSGLIGEPSDVAYACLFLASPFARYITGHTLSVNGGLFMN